MKSLNHILRAYRDGSTMLFFKARFLFIAYAALIVSLVLITIYTAIINMLNPLQGYAVNFRVVGPVIGLTLLLVGCSALLVRGYFAPAAHVTLSAIIITVWTAIIMDHTTILARLDTVVLALAVLSSTPLFVKKNKTVVILYAGLNLAALYTYMLLFGSDLGLPKRAIIEYLADNTIAFVFTGIIAYNLFSINARALDRMEQAVMNVERTNEELRVTMEELTATNSESEARNQALRKSEEKFHKLFVNSPGILSVNTAVGLFYQDANDRFFEVTGYHRNEVIGRTVRDLGIISNEDIEFLGSELQQSRRVKNHEVHFITKSGEKRLASLTIDTVDIDGIPHFVVIANDITETREIEREMMNMVSEERRHIGQDLHDDLGQTLTGVAFLVQTLRQELKDLPGAGENIIGKISGLVNNAIMKVRTISKMLIPVEMESQGFITAIEEMVANIHEVFLISCEVLYDGDVEVHDNVTASNLYYIAREAVNNAIKHGKADEIRIHFSVLNDVLIMTITDNGTGIDATRPSEGIGLKTIDYRARIIGATARIYGRDSGGTCVSIAMPLN
jgi:PAS domain S-box-containing protein